MTMNTAVSQQAAGAWPCFEEEEMQAALAVLRSGKINYWTGQEGRCFEEEYAASLGRRHAIAMANGTLALEACMVALGIGAGDEVVVPSRTFIATAACVATHGGRPVVVDVEADSQNLTAETIAPVLSPRTKAIIAVHLAGWPCDMEPIMHLARAHGIAVVEDCAQAHGALYRGRPVGSWGDMAAFSFCQDKILSTGGEGGLVVCDDTHLWERAWSFKDHGKNFAAAMEAQAHPEGGFRWLHDTFGSNYRMTEMQSAMGRVLLRKLPRAVAARRERAHRLAGYCQSLPGLRVPMPGEDCFHSYYKFYCFIRPEALRPGWTRDRIQQEIRDRGIPCYTGSCSEIYREAAFPPAWRPVAPLPIARQLGETSLMFLVHPTLPLDQIQRHAGGIEEVITKAMAPLPL